jgi:hypothetical protein
MQCSNCKTEILAVFKYSFAKNECPACGKPIMDEESLALMEDMQRLLLAEGNIRQETAQKLAMSLIASYNISFRGGASVQKKDITETKMVSTPSPKTPKNNINVVKAEDMPSNGISDEERDRIYEEVVRKKYAIVDQIQAMGGDIDHGLDTPDIDFDPDMLSPASLLGGSGGELESTMLERDRLQRLEKQRQAVESGFSASGKQSSVRRSS